MGVTPELEANILEKRGDVLAILQLIREEDPDLLAKWEKGQPSFSGADDSGTAQQLLELSGVQDFFFLFF